MARQGRDEDWLPPALRVVAAERRLKAGEALFRQGDKSEGFYQVVAGRVRLARVDAAGHEIVLHVAGPSDVVAEASLFSATYHCDAIAGSAAVVRIFPKREVLAAFERDPQAAQAFTAMLARQVMRLRARIEQRNIRSARDRLRHWLALNAGRDGRTVALPGTLKELAAELGLTHEALYRTLAALERSGEIERLEGQIVLRRAAKA
jgi:CRP-like cAMP-binding protein